MVRPVTVIGSMASVERDNLVQCGAEGVSHVILDTVMVWAGYVQGKSTAEIRADRDNMEGFLIYFFVLIHVAKRGVENQFRAACCIFEIQERVGIESPLLGHVFLDQLPYFRLQFLRLCVLFNTQATVVPFKVHGDLFKNWHIHLKSPGPRFPEARVWLSAND